MCDAVMCDAVMRKAVNDRFPELYEVLFYSVG